MAIPGLFWVETEERLGISCPTRRAQPWFEPESIFTTEEWRQTARAYGG